MTSPGRRRGIKAWIVEPYKQVKLGLMFLLVNTVFAVLIFGVFGYYVWDIYKAVSAIFALSGQESNFTLFKFGWPIAVGLALILLFVAVTLLLSIRYTHQIYGPLVSIHRFLDDVLVGNDPGLLQLRESDQLKDLASKLNTVAGRLALQPQDGVSRKNTVIS